MTATLACVQETAAASTVTLRRAGPADAPRLHALITAYARDGHLLPRTLDEIAVHAGRFVAGVRGGEVVACAELAPLSARVAEVRSLVVDSGARGEGVGRQLVAALADRAARDGFEILCAFTHDARFFVRLGFSIVPHTWIPEKIALDCHGCAQFRRCGQSAVTLRIHPAARKAGRSVAGVDVA